MWIRDRGLHKDNGKENGTYHVGSGYQGLPPKMENQMQKNMKHRVETGAMWDYRYVYGPIRGFELPNPNTKDPVTLTGL